MVQWWPTNGLFLSSSMWCFLVVQNEDILQCLKSLSAKFDALVEDVDWLKCGQSETADTTFG